MKTQENHQYELISQNTALGETLIKLSKAKMILDIWIQDYGFPSNPNLNDAVAWMGSKSGEQTREEVNSVKWYLEYDLIYGLIDIVHDYVYESKKILENALEKKGA
ncbi:MAG TPA: hypothetical protein GX523_06695 [Desulfitobacterium dehalogenans]|uniref:Uncharacterized protein n=1 Tax=Desulfitobacterium dehalogenans TaxID=36854 RepID=A0A7C6Z3U1_9FIRM|nr:hypothetical protein [Desulfitobacterium dehalogenans]